VVGVGDPLERVLTMRHQKSVNQAQTSLLFFTRLPVNVLAGSEKLNTSLNYHFHDADLTQFTMIVIELH
jgi:hypothetical protein